MTGGSIGGETIGERGNEGVHPGNIQSSMFDSFPPVTLTVSSFFKQVNHDESNQVLVVNELK